MMCANETPPWIASMQACSFGRIPPAVVASAAEVRERLPEVSGGMRPKLEACLHELEAGVGNAHIVDGRTPHSLLLELFTDQGIGTKLWL